MLRQPADSSATQRSIGTAGRTQPGAVAASLAPWRQVTQPLFLAVLVAAAGYLTLGRFAPELGTALPALERFLDNGFCQVIIVVFVVATVYSALQALGQMVDRRHWQVATGERYGERMAHRVACVLSGRRTAAEDGLLQATAAWLSRKPNRQSLAALNDTVLALREQQSSQIVQVVHFFVWVMPLLGFIGTVVGISQAIGGLEAVVQEAGLAPGGGLDQVLGGLQFAFDTTFVGLLLVIPTMLYALSLRARAQQLDMLYHTWLLSRLLAEPDGTAPTERGSP